MIRNTLVDLRRPGHRGFLSWLHASLCELLPVVAVTVAALVPRVVDLVGIPPGLHGDEAWTGIRSNDILHGVNVGPFDRVHGLGQPAGMEYFTAGFVKVFGSSVLTLRLPMALIGAATVPLTYWLIRVMTKDRAAAAIGASFLAFMGWHIHFSRIALPPVSWPFFEVLSLLLLVQALRSGRWWLFAATGAALGMGVYTYSSYSVFVLAFAAFVVYWLLTQRLEQPRRMLLGVGTMTIVALIVALPMLDYIVAHQHTYFAYPRQISIFHSATYRHANGTLARADVLADAGNDFVHRVVFKPEADYSDGSGSGPMLDIPFSILLGLGILIALRRWRQPDAALPLLVVLIVPWSGILTTGGGIIRRAVGVTPFLAFLAARPLAELIHQTRFARPLVRGAPYVLVAGVIVGVAAINLKTYFDDFPSSDAAHFVFVPELVAASKYMDALPTGTVVYFYSERWSIDYETRRYLASHVVGEDRSKQFGKFSLDIDRSQDAAFVFLGNYVDQLEQVKRLYAGGTLVDRTGLFAAYYLPKSAALPSGGPPGPNGSLGNEILDSRRLDDFSKISDALGAYRQKNGAYPDSGGQVQTLCISQQDAGCRLKEVLDLLPEDPLGDPATNGYFYASNGSAYALYGLRQSLTSSPCGDHPPPLERLPSLLCAHGP